MQAEICDYVMAQEFRVRYAMGPIFTVFADSRNREVSMFVRAHNIICLAQWHDIIARDNISRKSVWSRWKLNFGEH